MPRTYDIVSTYITEPSPRQIREMDKKFSSLGEIDYEEGVTMSLYSGYSAAWVPAKYIKRKKQVSPAYTDFAYCRDVLLGRYCSVLSAESIGTKKSIDKHRTIVVAHLNGTKVVRVDGAGNAIELFDDDTMKKYVYFLKYTFINGLKNLNLVEKAHGIPLTIMKRVNYKGKVSKHVVPCIVMFDGSSKWMRSTQLLSLYFMLLRSGKYGPINGARSYKSFIRNVKSFSNLEMSVIKNTPPYDQVSNVHTIQRELGFMLNSCNGWSVFLNNINRLYRGRPRSVCFSRLIYKNSRKIKDYLKTSTSSPGYEGMEGLCSGGTSDTVLCDRFLKLCQESKLVKKNLKELSAMS